MTVKYLTSYNDNYTSNLQTQSGETNNVIYAMNGNDIVYGNGYADIIYGGNGSDYLNGEGNNDILIGESGNDILEGGQGNDLLVGGDNDDKLYGGQGLDRLWGGEGNDRYYAEVQNLGVDYINDDKSATGQTGHGGGSADIVEFFDLSVDNIAWNIYGNDLFLGNSSFDRGVIIEDFFLGGDNVVEYLVDVNGVVVDLELVFL